MMYKTVAVLLACQLVLVLARPSALEEKNAEGQDVKELIDELGGQGLPKETKHEKVIKKTVITTVEDEEPTLANDAQLKEFMKDPTFVSELKDFLLQFLKLFNSLNGSRKSGSSKTTTSTMINENDVDLQTVLKNPAFFDFLSNIFGGSSTNQQSGLYGIFSDLFNRNQRPSTSVHTVTTEEHINEHSRPVEVEPETHVTITHMETTGSESSLDERSPDEILTHITHEERLEIPTPAPTPAVVDRFEDTHVTITHLDENRHSGDEIAHDTTAEELLQQLRRHNNAKTTVHREEIVRPPVAPHRVVKEDWSEVRPAPSKRVESSEELAQQAKNAQFQFATQIDDRINGNFQQKAEVRRNGVLYGKYSYDDGYVWRTVYYEADGNGFRVTREETLPSHMSERTGEASVQTLMDGNLIDYHITERDYLTKKNTPVGKASIY
ncbi:unnamed protein product [Phyllotreta striolata]|uniref:Uncharacterized protein n=1 Tax=Phyllotreta striolata TaxID=444603 RepID=A0A9N9XQQ2_PHYSR|nr:unnamed protein product [Phyllotreta striolata]